MGEVIKCFIKRGEACLEMVDRSHWKGKECVREKWDMEGKEVKN